VTVQRGLLALSIGDHMGNLIAPFWYVVVAGVARVNFRDFFGYGLIFALLWFVLGVLIFTFAVSLLTGFLFSLLPTLNASKPKVNDVLKSGSKSATSSRGLKLWRDALVVAEVALSLILVVGAGLMIKSFSKLINVPPGFDPNNVLTGEIGLTRTAYENPEECARYVDQTLARLRALPGVERAAFVAPMPFSGGDVGSDFRIEGRPVPAPGEEPSANNRSVTTEYFQAMKIPLIKGRYFDANDRREGVGAAIVNQTFVQNYFPNEEVLGQVISHIGANQNEGDPEKWTIVGVVGDIKHTDLRTPLGPAVYMPYLQQKHPNGVAVYVQTTAPPQTVLAAIRQTVHQLDPTLVVDRLRTMETQVNLSASEERALAFLALGFAGLALLLAAVGLYGVLAYSTEQRTREIGVRLALGAPRTGVILLVVREMAVIASVAIAIALPCVVALARLFKSQLYGVTIFDPATLLGAVALTVIMLSLASALPARRAAVVEPMQALRTE